jgi:acyl-CoA thioesterase-2
VVSVEPLSALLDLEPVGEDAFRAPTHGADAGVERIFGGHVAAQALLAASRTVSPDRAAHSVHATFLRSGRPGLPVELAVVRERDGRAFSTRHVTVAQGPNVIFEMTASFHVDEPGDDWTATPMPDVPGPDEVDGRTFLHDLPTLSVFDWRVLGAATAPGELDAVFPCWVRAVEPLGDDPALRTAVVCAMTDLASVRGTMRPGFQRGEGFTGASLDHAVWFHRPTRPEGWLLLHMEPLSNHAGRGFGIGRAWTQDGSHVATWVQESLLRHR